MDVNITPFESETKNGCVRTERPVDNDQHHSGEKQMNSAHRSA
jgi:hypothetical protein